MITLAFGVRPSLGASNAKIVILRDLKGILKMIAVQGVIIKSTYQEIGSLKKRP
jgi:hypothetical protein